MCSTAMSTAHTGQAASTTATRSVNVENGSGMAAMLALPSQTSTATLVVTVHNTTDVHTRHTRTGTRAKLTKYVDTGTQAHNKTGHGTHAPRAEARDALSCQVRNRAVVCCSLLDWICLSCGNRKSLISNLCCCAAIPACKIV